MSTKTYVQLSTMMFLQFFIWGAWFVTLGTYLREINFTDGQVGNTYMMNNIAAIIAPFFVGMIADRYFASQKVMSVLHLLGGVFMFLATGIKDPGTLIPTLLLYNLCYMPTLALVNAVSFHQMENPGTQFPKVRVWGTIGWIVAGLVIGFVLSSETMNAEKTELPMKMAAAASILMGLYSFTLPNTPPKNIGKGVSVGEVLGLKALRLLKERNFLIFVLSSLLISIPLAFYYNFTNPFLNDLKVEGAAAKQTLGQMSEVVFMVLMPFFFARLGVKKMLLVGMLAWVARYALFASGADPIVIWMLYAGIILHGVCYDFFFVTGQIYVDKKASTDIRASAQGFIALITYGVGIGLGSWLSGKIVEAYTTKTTAQEVVDGVLKDVVHRVSDWPTIWLIPCAFALFIAILFAMTFKDDGIEKQA
ncbi:nucleoside permease [bacterium]|nr:nucleoside permease [bacterium]